MNSAAVTGAMPGKLVHLECARGIASVIVIFSHFCEAFLPVLKQAPGSGGLKFTPLYVLINGSGAVIFFFLLSGFVLTQGFFRAPEPDGLARAVIKRLPRLMLPASITVLAGYLILVSGLDAHTAAGRITGSEWLAKFGNATFPPGFEPSLVSALKQCLTVFLVPYNAFYNNNLWTMRDEFLGSLVVFAMSALFLVPRLRSAAVMIPMHVLLIAVTFFRHINFVPFLVGSGLAYLLAVRRNKLRIPDGLVALLLFAAAMAFSVDDLPALRILPGVAGSLLVMLALLGNERLAARLSGPFGRLLGEFSFPLYLVHSLLILSLSSSLLVWLTGTGLGSATALLLTFFATLAASVLFSLPFVRLERFWVPWLNRFMKRTIALPAFARKT